MASLPSQHKTLYVDFNDFSGGLNFLRGDLQLEDRETNHAENVWLENGLLHSRPGQEWASNDTGLVSVSGDPIHGYSATAVTFFDWTIIHIDDALYAWQDGRNMTDKGYSGLIPIYQSGAVSQNRGTFFRFDDYLFYKNHGGFFRIGYNADEEKKVKEAEAEGETPDYNKIFTVIRMDRAEEVEDPDDPEKTITIEPYVPTIMINADPTTGYGDVYQPENRLSSKKTITYNAADTAAMISTILHKNPDPEPVEDTGEEGEEDTDPVEDTSGVYTIDLGITQSTGLHGVRTVYVRGYAISSGKYYVNLENGHLIIDVATETADLSEGDEFRVDVEIVADNQIYNLPVSELDAVTLVKVDGKTLAEGDGYTVNLENGYVRFISAPPVTDPPTNNTVEITYSKANEKALSAVMDCPYAAVYGGGTQMCLVFGGCDSQPNAIFWSGNNSTGLDPGYWPMESYSYVGDTDDRVTAFGKQYDQLFVFKSRSIGKLGFTIESINERDVISLTYKRVNDKIGCDLPWTVQLIENNLVFANTSGGVFLMFSASAAYENDLQCISLKINGDSTKNALLYDLRTAYKESTEMEAGSLDDGRHYWISANHHVWVWDYSISGWKDPCWWYWTGIETPATWFMQNYQCFHLGPAGQITRMGTSLTDYGEAIRKVYQIPARGFGSFDRLKDVMTLILTAPPNIRANIHITYITDWETRSDRVSLMTQGFQDDKVDLSTGNITLPDDPRNLRHSPLVSLFRRRPMCRHIRCFAIRMENYKENEDLAVYALQLQIRFLGRDR